MKSGMLYKFLSVVLAVLLALGGAYAWKQIHDARIEVAIFRDRQDEVQAQLTEQKAQLQKTQEFLQRLQNDPAFLDYIARERLGYARPDETIYRFDVDPLTGAASAGKLDSSTTPLLAPPPSTAAKPGPAHRTP
jgi:cell division protein FtsB